MRSITEQCLNRMIGAARRNEACPSKSGNTRVSGIGRWYPLEQIGCQSGSVRKRERLGGTLNYYFRLAG